MKFIDRVATLEEEGAYAVLARAQELEAQGREVIHLEIGQPDFQTFPHIALAGIKAITEGQTRYNPPAGIPVFRKAIADFAGRQRGIEIDYRQVVVGPGSKPGLFFTTLALVQPGDEVIYPNPGFPTYEAMIRVAGATPVPVPLLEEKNFSFDLSAFEKLVNRHTRLIILNSPANPTAGIIPAEDLQVIADTVRERKCWVISDEIYTRHVYGNQQVPSIASLPGMQEHVIIVDGFSKTYAMTGWRLGYAIMPEALAERVSLLLTHSVGCTATFTQYAGLAALTSSQAMADAVLPEYQRRRDFIVAGLNAIPGVRCQVPQGAFFVFPNIKAFGLSSAQLASRLLDEAGVAVLAGTDFGIYGEGYLRLCYATSLEKIAAALAKIDEFFKGIRG